MLLTGVWSVRAGSRTTLATLSAAGLGGSAPRCAADADLLSQINVLTDAERDHIDQLGEQFDIRHYCNVLRVLQREEEERKAALEQRKLGGRRRVSSRACACGTPSLVC